MESAFSVDMLTINDGSDDESSLLVGISYGEESGSRPTGTGFVDWFGSLVGAYKTSGDIVQGNAQIQVNLDSNSINLISFSNFRNLSNNTAISTDMIWINFPVDANGTFSSTTGGDIDGAFYGTGHTEVGGTFDRDGIIGAFGGTRQ